MVYELARNFERDDPSGHARGRQLFSYLKQYLDLDIPSTKQLWELIMAEDEAFKKNLSVIDPLATSQESAIEKREVEKLHLVRIRDRSRFLLLPLPAAVFAFQDVRTRHQFRLEPNIK